MQFFFFGRLRFRSWFFSFRFWGHVADAQMNEHLCDAEQGKLLQKSKTDARS
jgi:hypothetical protein